MIDIIKSTITISFFYLVWGLMMIFCYRFGHKKTFYFFFITGFISFLISSTSYVPKKLVHNMESQYAPLSIETLDVNKRYYIYVLGAGYSLDSRLPAIANLNNATLARLVEGVRLYRALPNSILVTSGHSSLGKESQASVARKAAIEIGVMADRIRMLETASTTKEEVTAFEKDIGRDKEVIVVTDAMHISRALKLFEARGLKPRAAPTNFKIRIAENVSNGLTLPCFNSLSLMDMYLRENFADTKRTLGL